MTNKRRYLISTVVIAAGVCVALAVFAMLPTHPGVTKANFDRIEKGMTRAEVEAVLGIESTPLLEIRKWLPSTSGEVWHHADGSSATIMFDNGRVYIMHWSESTESLTDKLHRWLRLPK